MAYESICMTNSIEKQQGEEEKRTFFCVKYLTFMHWKKTKKLIKKNYRKMKKKTKIQ